MSSKTILLLIGSSVEGCSSGGGVPGEFVSPLSLHAKAVSAISAISIISNNRFSLFFIVTSRGMRPVSV